MAEFIDKALAEFKSNRYYADRGGPFGVNKDVHDNWQVLKPVKWLIIPKQLHFPFFHEVIWYGVSNILHVIGYGVSNIGNGCHAAISGVGFVANTVCKAAGSVLKNIGNICQAPFGVYTMLARETKRTSAKVLYYFTAAVISPFTATLYAIGTASKMVGSVADKVGTIAQTACAVVANGVRAVAHVTSLSLEVRSAMAQTYGAFTRLVTTDLVSCVVTEPLKSLGASVKKMGNSIDGGDPDLKWYNPIRMVASVVRGAGNVINATAVLTDGVAATVRNVMTASPKEAVQTLAAGAKAALENVFTKWQSQEYTKNVDGETQHLEKAVVSKSVELSKAGHSASLLDTSFEKQPRADKTPPKILDVAVKQLKGRM